MNKNNLALLSSYLCISIFLLSCNNNSEQVVSENDPDNTDNTIEVNQFEAYLQDIAGTTERVNISGLGVETNFNSINSDVSADGRFVVFDSLASNLVDGDTNNTWDVFLRDRLLNETARISVTSSMGDSNNSSLEPKISEDGRFITFSSIATNLVVDDNNGVSDVFVFDRETGLIQRISVSSADEEGNGTSESPAISEDGRYLVFSSQATNMVANVTLSGNSQIYLHDRSNGTTRLVSVGVDSLAGNGASRSPSISAGGGVVSFDSGATNLVEQDNNQRDDIFVYSSDSQVLHRVSVSNNNLEANEGSVTPIVSGNGRFVTFRSNASNLVDNDLNQERDVFVSDLELGTVELVSVSTDGLQANSSVFTTPDISFDGRYVVYYSSASNLVNNDNNNAWDVFLRDRQDKTTTVISVNNSEVLGNGSSFEPSITSDGAYVVFGSQASNFVNNDTNDAWDIFIRVLVSSNQAPIAIAGDDQQAYLGETVMLDGANSFDPDVSGLLNYSWFIESAPVSSNASIINAVSVTAEFTPDMLGEYVIKLIVDDGDFFSDPSEMKITVVENLSPTAEIIADFTFGEAPLTVMFNAQNSRDPENNALIYHWDFGDPSSNTNSGSGVEIQHTFTQANTYRVFLSVEDPFGNSDDAYIDITVKAQNTPPTVTMSADVTQGSAPLNVNFNAYVIDADDDSITYMWSFGDGTTSDVQNPEHIFSTAGNYTVRLSVSDGNFTVGDSIAIVVGSPMSLQVKSAYIHLGKPGKIKDKIRLFAKLDTNNVSLPGEAVQVTIIVDGVIVLDELAKAVNGNHPGKEKFNFRDNKKTLWIDFHKKQLFFMARRQLLDGINNENGVSISINISSLAATETIKMRQFSRCSDKESSHRHQYKERHYTQDNTCEEHQPHSTMLYYKSYRDSDKHGSDQYGEDEYGHVDD